MLYCVFILFLAFNTFPVPVNHSVFRRSSYVSTVLFVPVMRSGNCPLYDYINFQWPTQCIVLCDVNQHNAHFQIDVLIQFLVSSTCFELLTFIFRKIILHMQPYMLCFSC